MIKNKRRIIVVLIMVVAFIVATASVVIGASNMRNIQAYQGVKILYNGSELTDANQPLIIDNYTYVPLRMIMGKFGKTISWDAANKQVLITDSTNSTEATLKAQIAQKDAQISSLQNTINTLNSKISTVSSLESKLESYFEDAGSEYFGDSGITVSVSLNGDTSDLAYQIKLDFSYSDDYSSLKQVNTSTLKSFLNKVKTKLSSEIEDTEYCDADITGKLYDNDNSNYYVKYNGSSYSFSWSSSSDDLDYIESQLNDYFEDAGEDYFSDSGIITSSISLGGDDDDITYIVILDFSDSNNYSDLTDVSESTIRTFLNAVKTKLSAKTSDTDYEDADITGKLYDNNHSSYYVEYNGSSYTFSWD